MSKKMAGQRRLQLGISGRLAIVFVIFAAAILVTIGTVAYLNGRSSLQEAAVSELLSTSIEKQAALDAWMSERQQDLVSIASSNHVRDDVVALIATGTRPGDPLASALLIADLGGWIGTSGGYRELLVIEAETGMVIAATDASEVGKFKGDHAFFNQGKLGPTVQNPYFDLTSGGPTATAAAPIFSADGRLLAVLAGDLDLADMNTIVARRTGLHRSDDAYLINTDKLMVTQPRLLTDPSVLQRMVTTEAVNRCMVRNSGSLSSVDYRGIPALIVYRWLPQLQLCLITKIDEEEALAAERSLAMALLLADAFVLIIATGVSYWLSRGITFPIRQLTAGALQVGAGNLDDRMADKGTDEIGDLARAFNRMTAALSRSRAETAERQRLLVAVNEVSQAVQRSRSTAEVFKILAGEVASLGYLSIIAEVGPDGRQLLTPFDHLDEGQLAAAQDVVGFPLMGLVVPLAPGAYIDHAMGENRGIFVEPAAALVAEALPEPARPLAGILADRLKLRAAIAAPIMRDSRVLAVLSVAGGDLTEADVPAVTALANQAAIALENARLYQEALAWATELEARVQERTGELQASEERYRHIFENAPIGIFHSLPSGRYVRVNPAYAAMLGYDSPEDMVASITDIAHQIHVDPNRRAEILAQLAGVDGWLHAETAYRRRDGRVVVANLSLRKQCNADGNLAYLEGLVEDVTERRRAEEKLKAFSVDLERSNKELEQFAYVASHDLQEPLRMVASYTQLLGRRYQGKLDADADDFIGFAVEGATRMQQMINDLLAFSRVGTRGEAFLPTDLSTVLDDVISDLQVAIRESAAVITRDPMPMVVGDRAQLNRLFQNLLTNAIKFRGEAAPRVHVSAARSLDTWEFSVADNGIGVDPKYFDRIFIIFQRLNQRKSFPGTGMGLAICKKIVERHGGRIWVTSEPGKGATFHFTLPAPGVAACPPVME